MFTTGCEYPLDCLIFDLPNNLKLKIMQTINPPPQGYTPEQLQEKLQALLKNIEAYREILACKLNHVTIVVQGSNGNQAVNRILNFPPGNIPLEITEFLESSYNRMEAERLTIENGYYIYKIGNILVELTEFIKTYTAGEIPAVDALDIEHMKNMQPGHITVIAIDGVPARIQRIS